MSRNRLCRRLLVPLKTNSGLKLGILFVGLCLAGACAVFLIENGRNEGFTSLFDSIYWSLVTVATVGYGDIIPESTSSRIIAMGMMVVGIAIMGTVTGRIASFLMERQMNEEKGLLDYSRMQSHFLICGWKREMSMVLAEVFTRNPSLNPSEMILLGKPPQEEIDSLRRDTRFKGIRYVHGDFIEERDLIRAGARGATRALVLADFCTEGDLQQIDSKTVMAVMSLKNLNRKAYVCAELLDTKFQKYLKLSHCDEILLSRDFSRSMLASASLGIGLSHVVNALTSTSNGAALEIIDIPDAFIGKSYREVTQELKKRGKYLVLGLLENTGNVTERKREALREAQKNPDISALVPDLRSVKTLVANEPIINPPLEYHVKRFSRAIAISGSTVTATQQVTS